MKKIFLLSLLFMFSKAYSQKKWTLQAITGLDYYKTERIFSESQIFVSSGYIPNRPRTAFHIGVKVNVPIYKLFSFDFSTYYALAGFRQVLPYSTGAPISPYDNKLFDFHQLSISLNPSFQLKKHISANVGIQKNFTKLPIGDIWVKPNWAGQVNLNYDFNKMGIGLGYTHYFSPYFDFITFKYTWQVYSLNFYYKIASF